MDGWEWLIIVIIIIVLIAVLLWLILVQIQVQNLNNIGGTWTLTYGSVDQMSDQVPGGGGNLFIAQTQLKSGYTTQIQAADTSAEGQNLWINNRSAFTITITAADGVSLNNNNLGTTLSPGGLAQYVYSDTNKLLRLT